MVRNMSCTHLSLGRSITVVGRKSQRHKVTRRGGGVFTYCLKCGGQNLIRRHAASIDRVLAE